MTTTTMLTKVTTMKTRFAALGLLSTMLLGLSGCPLQSSAISAGVSSGDITVTGQTSPAVNQTFVLQATAKDPATTSFAGATWKSSEPSIVQIVSSNGPTASVKALKAGQSVITVTAGDKSGSVTVTVIQPVGSILVEGATSLNLGDESTYTAKVTDSSGKAITVPVSWSAAGSVELAATSSSGRVKTKALGAGAVSASAGGMTGQIAVTVALGDGKLAVAQADGTAFPSMIAAGQSVSVRAQYKAKAVSADATDAQWSVTGGCTLQGTAGATVQVQSNSAGTCMVTATARGMTATASFTVINVTSIKITGDTTGALKLRGTRTLTAVALSGTTEIATVPVTWTQTSGAVTLQQTGNMVTATGVGVGQAVMRASVGAVVQTVMFAVEPLSLELTATGLSVVAGGGATVTVTPKGMAGAAGIFITAEGVALTGTTGFSTVGPATLTPEGLVTFTLAGAMANSAAVKATFGAVTSNALAFTLATVTKVVVTGPVGPVRVGSDVELKVVVTDAQNMPIAEGGLPVTWADASGTLTLPAMTDGFTAKAVVAKLGTTSVVATVKGVVSAPYAFPGVPNSVAMTIAPGTIAVGGTATATVSVLNTGMTPIAGVPLAEVIVTSADPTKVSVGPVVAAAGNTFTVALTGVAPAAAPGVGITVKWMQGTEDVVGDTRQLIVAAGQVAWEGACVASPLGPKTWRVSGFQGATSGGSAIVYDIYAALGAAAALKPPSKVATDAASGVAKDVTVASVGADWRFGVVARAADGATSAVIMCTRGATVASPTVATSAVILSGAGVYADDTTMAVAATNPRTLLMVAPDGSALVRTAPRQSISFGGGLVGIGVRADNMQILYKRPGTGQGADASQLPTALAVPTLTNGPCTSRAGLTAFELSGKVTAAGALTSFALYTSAGTATGDAADCALNVLAFREGATKTIASGVDRVAAFGDHRLGYTYSGALFDVDLTTASKVPRLLADDGLAAGSLIAGVSPTTGTAGAIEATSIYVLSPTGVVSRYTVGAPPLAAPLTSAVTASLANADGFVALDGDTLLVTSGGTLKVVEVSGAGPLTLGVTTRDYSSFGTPAFSVTLGALPAVAQ